MHEGGGAPTLNLSSTAPPAPKVAWAPAPGAGAAVTVWAFSEDRYCACLASAGTATVTGISALWPGCTVTECRGNTNRKLGYRALTHDAGTGIECRS